MPLIPKIVRVSEHFVCMLSGHKMVKTLKIEHNQNQSEPRIFLDNNIVVHVRLSKEIELI